MKTTAAIVDLTVNPGTGDESDTYILTVEYTVDGKTYTRTAAPSRFSTTRKGKTPDASSESSRCWN